MAQTNSVGRSHPSAGRPRISGRPRARLFPLGGMLFGSRPRITARKIETSEDKTGLWLVDLTSVSLLDRLKAAEPEAIDWERLQGIYLPLIQRWLRRVPGLGTEADDPAPAGVLGGIPGLPRCHRRAGRSVPALPP